MRIKFNNTPLVIKQNNYTTKIMNIYVVYDLYNLAKKSAHKFYNKKLYFLVRLI